MVIILGDILADYAIRIERLAIHPKDLQRVSYLGLGPGGACNVAIMASHLGLAVSALGEVGQDLFGEIVLEGLVAEGVDVSHVIVTPDARTPVANVLVDEQGEPAYLGFPGSLKVMSLPDEWRPYIAEAEALYGLTNRARPTSSWMRSAKPTARTFLHSSIPGRAIQKSITRGIPKPPRWQPSCWRRKKRPAASRTKKTRSTRLVFCWRAAADW